MRRWRVLSPGMLGEALVGDGADVVVAELVAEQLDQRERSPTGEGLTRIAYAEPLDRWS